MTTYQINEKYDKMLKHEVDQEFIDIFFSTDELRNKLKDPDKIKTICEMRMNKNTYAKISKVVNISHSTVRLHYNKIIRIYNRYINDKRHEELKTAKTANVQEFAKNAKLHDIDVELLTEEIVKLPIWDIESVEERYIKLLEWFYKEKE